MNPLSHHKEIVKDINKITSRLKGKKEATIFGLDKVGKMDQVDTSEIPKYKHWPKLNEHI